MAQPLGSWAFTATASVQTLAGELRLAQKHGMAKHREGEQCLPRHRKET